MKFPTCSQHFELLLILNKNSFSTFCKTVGKVEFFYFGYSNEGILVSIYDFIFQLYA